MKAVVLFAHGSRDPQWHQPMKKVAQRIAVNSPQVLVRCAYLELTEPDLSSVVTELALAGATHVRVLPMFLGVGKHAREDLPVLMAQLGEQHPHILFDTQPAVGEQSELLDLLAQIALRDL